MVSVRLLRLVAVCIVLTQICFGHPGEIPGGKVQFDRTAVAVVVRWSTESGYGKPVPLKSGDTLNVKDKVTVKKGFVVISYRAGKPDKVFAGKTVKVGLRTKPGEDEFRAWLAEQTKPGAKPKGDPSPILMPGNSTPVPLDTFEIDLKEPISGRREVVVTTPDSIAEPIYKGVLEFTDGRAQSPALAEVLRQERRRREGSSSLEGSGLRFQLKVDEVTKEFDCMSSDSESALSKDLHAAGLDPDPILRILRKAETLSRNHLYLLAANEMDNLHDLLKGNADEYAKWAAQMKQRLVNCSLLEAGHRP